MDTAHDGTGILVGTVEHFTNRDITVPEDTANIYLVAAGIAIYGRLSAIWVVQ